MGGDGKTLAPKRSRSALACSSVSPLRRSTPSSAASPGSPPRLSRYSLFPCAACATFNRSSMSTVTPLPAPALPSAAPLALSLRPLPVARRLNEPLHDPGADDAAAMVLLGLSVARPAPATGCCSSGDAMVDSGGGVPVGPSTSASGSVRRMGPGGSGVGGWGGVRKTGIGESRWQPGCGSHGYAADRAPGVPQTGMGVALPKTNKHVPSLPPASTRFHPTGFWARPNAPPSGHAAPAVLGPGVRSWLLV